MKALAQRSNDILQDAMGTTNNALDMQIPQELEPIVYEEVPPHIQRSSPPKNADEVDRMIYDFVEK